MDTETARCGYSDVLFLGLHFFFIKLIQSVDTATARRGYRDGKAWIQRRQGMAIATSYSWVCIFFFKTLYRAWIQRHPGVDIETARRGYRKSLDI